MTRQSDKGPTPPTPLAHDDELMAFFDGELPPKEARAFEALLQKSPADRDRLAALGQLSDVLAQHYKGEADTSEPTMAAAWARLEAELEQTPRPRQRAATNVGQTFWQKLADALSPRWSHLFTGAAGVAVGAILVLSFAKPTKIVVQANAPAPAPVLPAVVNAMAEDTQIDSLEAVGNAMVFQVPATDGSKPATTVIWVADQDMEKSI